MSNQQPVSQQNQKYAVLLIITDGEINDMNEVCFKNFILFIFMINYLLFINFFTVYLFAI